MRRGRHRGLPSLWTVAVFWTVMLVIAVISAVNYNLEGRP
jgi:hypothetical protein